jgi:D-lyxose ketol-isomerase
MKRSEINGIMREADRFIRQHGFYLPPFCLLECQGLEMQR